MCRRPATKTAPTHRAAYSFAGVTVFLEPEPNDADCISPDTNLRHHLIARGFSLVEDKSSPHALDMRFTRHGCAVKDVEIAHNGVVLDAVTSEYGYSDASEVVDKIASSDRIAAALRAPTTKTASATVPTTKRRLGKPTSLLMLPLKPVSGVAQTTLDLISAYMLGRLDTVEGLRTVGRDDLEASLGVDKQRQALGCDALACMAEIGGALGVELVMYGQVGGVGSKYNVNVSVVRANDAHVIARTAVMTEPTEDAVVAQLEPLISELVDKVDARH